jgi:hypothetical protein
MLVVRLCCIMPALTKRRMSRPLEKGSISTNDGVPPLEQHFACGFMSCGGSWNRQPANSELLAMKESLASMMWIDVQVWFSIADGRSGIHDASGYRIRPLRKLTEATRWRKEKE